MGNTITFLSTCKKKINVDLKSVKDEIMTRLPDKAFQYYIKDAADTNPFITEMMCKAREQVLNDYASDIICMDLSLPEDVKSKNAQDVRLLLFTPFDYQFRDYLELKEGKSKGKKTGLKGFTHVIPGSPFSRMLLDTVYESEGLEIIDHVCLPLSADISNEEKCSRRREEFERYYPGAKGKKLLALVLDGKKSSLFKKFDLKKWVDQMGEDYFLIISSEEVARQALMIPYAYHDRIGVIHEGMLKSDLLYIADVMITNISRYITAFAAKKKPLYYFEYGEKLFGKYMKENYPSMYFSKAADLYKINFADLSADEKARQFYEEFSYEVNEKPFEIIEELFK